MGLENFAESSDEHQTSSKSGESHVSPDNESSIDPEPVPTTESETVGDRFFGEGTPNDPPIIYVDEKLAADMEIIDDENVVQEVVEFWSLPQPDRYVSVLKVTFNDFSNWHIPLPPWEKDYAKTRVNTIDKYMPEIIRWHAIVEGEDPEPRLQDWESQLEPSEPEWYGDLEKTGISEETREKVNNQLSAVPYIDKKIESTTYDADIEVEDDSWEDDW